MSRLFYPGQIIKSSGIYRVIHGDGPHYKEHEVTVISGAKFPHCMACGDQVRFVRVHLARAAEKHPEFNLSPQRMEAEDTESGLTESGKVRLGQHHH